MNKQHLQNLLALADIAIKTGTIPAESLGAAGECIMTGRQLFGLMKDHEVLNIGAPKTPATDQPSEAQPKLGKSNIPLPKAK